MAYEYLLRIISSLDVWKEDMQILSLLSQFLSEQRKVEKEQEDILEQIQNINHNKSILKILKKHVPEFMQNITVNPYEFNKLVEIIKKKEFEQIKEEEYLKNYLSKKKKEMPFLFD